MNGFDAFPRKLALVRERIEAACDRSGRDVGDVTLIAVTKGHDFAAMQTAVDHGVLDLGENRVQDALPKLERVDPSARVHLIGQLQTNKVNKVVGRFASIMGVDRVELLDRIARRAEDLDVVQPIWIQVNVSAEEQKGGCAPEEAAELRDRALERSGLDVIGCMTMARADAAEAELRGGFSKLRQLCGGWRSRGGRPFALSMGMSGDFEIAIEEGATHVRLGTVLFGPRG